MSSENLGEMTVLAKSAAKGLDQYQSDLTASENFVLIRGAKVRNSMSQTFISDLQNDKHVSTFLNFLDKK